MKTITIHRVQLQFDADQTTQGTDEDQAQAALDQVNAALQREPFGLGAQLIAYNDEIEVTTSDDEG